MILLSGIYLEERRPPFFLCHLNTVSFLLFKLPETDTDIGAARYAGYLHIMLLWTPSNKHQNDSAQKKVVQTKSHFEQDKSSPSTKQSTPFPAVKDQWQNAYRKAFFISKQISKHLIRWSNKNWYLLSISLKRPMIVLNRNVFINRTCTIKFPAASLSLCSTFSLPNDFSNCDLKGLLHSVAILTISILLCT